MNDSLYADTNVTSALDDYLDENEHTSNSSSARSSESENRNNHSHSKQDQEQHDYENPIQAFQRKQFQGSPYAQKYRDDLSSGSDEENQGNLSARGLQESNHLQNIEINVRQTITEGSFLPVTLLANQGKFDVNGYVIDHQQGAKLVHYIGTYGKIKALKTFIAKFGMDLTMTDLHGQTIVHYAARRGELNMLKYLNQIGPERGITLEMENAHGLAPIMYTMLNQQVYSFVYLYFKLKCQLDRDSTEWAVKHMVRQSTKTEIIEIMLHDVALGHIVAREALKNAVETGNTNIIKVVLGRLQQVDPQCIINIVPLAQIQEYGRQCDEKEVVDLLNDYLASVSVEQYGAVRHMFSLRILHKSILKAVQKKVAPFTGFVVIFTLHIFFLIQVLRAQSFQASQESEQRGMFEHVMESFNKNFFLFSIALVLQFNSISCLLWSLMNQEEVQPRLRLDQKENAITRICHLIDQKQQTELPSLDKFCLTCLTCKYEHLEHCSSTNKCIRNFHYHSTLLNRSFSNRNIRGFVAHQLLSFATCVIYIYLMSMAFWDQLTTEFTLLRPLELYTIIPYNLLLTLIALQMYSLQTLDTFIHAISAAFCGMTMNEYANIEKYDYLFDMTTINGPLQEGKPVYTHREVSLADSTRNILAFLCLCFRPLGKRHQKGVLAGNSRRSRSLNSLVSTEDSMIELERSKPQSEGLVEGEHDYDVPLLSHSTSPESIQQEHDIEAAISADLEPTKKQSGSSVQKQQAAGFLGQRFGIMSGHTKSHEKSQ